MVDGVARLTRTLSDLERRLSGLERGAQLQRASVDVDGVAVPIADGVAAGSRALTAAEQAAITAADAGSAATGALEAANGKSRVWYRTTQPPQTGNRVDDLWFDTANQFRPNRWTGTAWLPALLGNAALSSITVGKLVSGTLAAGVSITAGNPLGDYTMMTAEHLLAHDSDGRTVRVTHTLAYQSPAGNTSPGAGLIFETPSSVYRWGQIYSTPASLNFDSPAFESLTGSQEVGVSFVLQSNGLFAYTEGRGPGSESDAMQLRNDGYSWFGTPEGFRPHLDLRPDSWILGPTIDSRNGVLAARGSRVRGDNLGYWEIGNVRSGAFPRAIGYSDGTFFMGTDDRQFVGRADGTWFMGHSTNQAIYSVGDQLVLRGRQVNNAGPIGAYLAPGNFFTFYTSDNGATQGGVYVNGRFGVSGPKQFIIEHPTDPDRMLVHASTESPRAGVEYWGEATANEAGKIRVTLPPYFEPLTRDEGRAILVTPVNASVAVTTTPITDGHFTISAEPGTLVYWLVKAVRGDRESGFEVEPLRSTMNLPDPDSDEMMDDPESVRRQRQRRDVKETGRGASPRRIPRPPVTTPIEESHGSKPEPRPVLPASD